MICRVRQNALTAAQNPGRNRVFSCIKDRRLTSTALSLSFP
ncbi:MAG TPA: hypothetical protein PK545_08695 [Deltaproteobacteria bacterium]|nr:hypothetical protein [Deltaproteobacteria bacterium]